MKMNEAPWDRALRLTLGVVLTGLATSGLVGYWGYIGIVPLITGMAGMCPLYSLLGISTCRVKPK